MELHVAITCSFILSRILFFKKMNTLIQKQKTWARKITAHIRILKKLRWRIIKYAVYGVFLLWLRRVENMENLPRQGPAIIVSNHLSYFDWGVLSAIYGDLHLVFIANKDILKRPVVGWLMWINIPIFIDPQAPGFSYLKEALFHLRENRILVIYPEGTRSRSGKMLEPKTGFIKIALQTGAPVIPIGMKGSFETLPPHKCFPAFRKFDIAVGDPIVISHDNPEFKDLFEEKAGRPRLSPAAEKQAAIRVMNKVRTMTGQAWEEAI